ncbi:lysozyme inhibitor LprI family protein [Flaviflagellibacter deserti]|uniref:Lysozyme inhibitor LprI family protein n=1 Tax=Flaviflagellibacter deserti TaxID=2267266 RepID=A0ABV9YZE3_9HYPH
MKLWFAPLAIAVLATTPAHAQECNESSNQHELHVCADEAYKKTNAELNTTYQEIMGRLKDDDPTREMLVKAQRAWLAFRDAECDFATFAAKDGSIWPMLNLQCLGALTAKRIIDLKVYLNCEEGDMSCPVPAPQ